MFQLRWTLKGECSGLVETSAAIIKETFFLGCQRLVFATTPLTQKYVCCMSSQMKFSGNNVYIKKLEFQSFEPETYRINIYALRITLFGPKKSSFLVLLRLSFTGFHLAPGHDFEINHVKMVILKMIPQLPNLTPKLKKMLEMARCRR